MTTADEAIRVVRITLPHYEIIYPSVERALQDAYRVRDMQDLVVPRVFPEKLEDSIVIDLTVEDLAFRTTLLFRFTHVSQTHSKFAWWARRKTDGDLLALWIRTLEAELPATVRAPELSRDVLRQILALCRRTLSRNPFEAINVHWSVGADVISASARSTLKELQDYRRMSGLDVDTQTLLDRSIANISDMSRKLDSVHERRLIRRRFVPANQLQHARELARSKLGIAKIRGEYEAIQEATAELAELVEP